MERIFAVCGACIGSNSPQRKFQHEDRLNCADSPLLGFPSETGASISAQHSVGLMGVALSPFIFPLSMAVKSPGQVHR